MYLHTGFGHLAEPLPKDSVSGGSISRIIFVPFKRDFGEFSKEVRKALGRYTVFRSDRGAYLERLLSSEPTFPQGIQMSHQFMLSAIPPAAESTPTKIFVTFYYTPGFKKVTRITFP